MCAISSSLGMLQNNKVSIDQFMDLLRGSSSYAPLFDQKLERLLRRDYESPQLSVKNLLQELNLLTEALEDHDINAPFIEGAQDVLYLTLAKGLTDSDFSAMHDVVFPPRNS